MQLEQTFDVPSRPERVWHWFKDTEAVVTCLPGASLLAPPDEGRLRLAMVVKLGPISANFVGDGEVRFDDAARSGTVVGAASDRKSGSRIKGQVGFTLSDIGTAAAPLTRVALAIEQTMAGPLAQFSREGIVRELAQRLTDEFATRLRAKIEAEGAAEATVAPDGIQAIAMPALGLQAGLPDSALQPSAAAAASVTLASVPQPAAAPSLNLGSLLWEMLVGRIRKLFRRDRNT